MNQIIIYTLSDPQSNKIRYVGKTKNSLTYRLSQHIRECILFLKQKRKLTRKNNWIVQLLEKGLIPVINELENVEAVNWKNREIYWIKYFKEQGFDLVNLTDGGEGNNNQHQSLESNLKRSNALKGRKRPIEVINKISLSHKGKKLSEVTKEKLRQFNLGKKQSEESKLKKEVPVYMLNNEGNIINEFRSVKLAGEFVNCRPSTISNVCRGFCKTAGGYKWEYKN